ncbi:DUF2987 domain-containing protein [Niveispirillum fermenti]|uniref:DUF2987 domain-containing protein n=1 Tax=Niveispirillum fermenti TaxID=1233113 RepID=UPI003A8BB774
MRFPILAAILVMPSLAQPSLAAPGSHTAPYKEFHDEMVRFYAGNYDRLALRLSVQPADKAGPLDLPVTMVISTPEGQMPLVVDGDDQEVEMPFRPDWVAVRATVTINQAEGSYKMRAQIGMKLPAAAAFPYADVKQAFDQFGKLIDREAGVVSFLAPSPRTLRVVCGPDCTATLDGAKGRRVLKADNRGRINIPNDRNLARENPTLTFSHPVSYTVLTTKG